MGEITRLCGYLPLAIGMLASQLHHHPAWTTAGLAADLAAARDRLAVMRAENLSVAAAFDLSYQDLPAGQQRLFRRLGLHPGPDIDAHAAAALDGTTLEAARRGLEGLYGQHLLTEPALAATGCTTCSASTPRPWPPATTPPPAKRPPGGCWITTCTPRWPQAGTSPRKGSPYLVAARPATGLRAADSDPRAGLELAGGPNAPTCTRPSAMPPPPRGPCMPRLIPAAITGFLYLRGYWDQDRALLQDRPGRGTPGR